jgi:Tfp pilus assembly protein PilX
VYAAPIFTVAYLGPAPSGLGQGVLYQVTALGYGANPNATAVVQSVYYVGSPSQCVSDCN